MAGEQYLDAKGVTPLLNEMVADVIRELPEDPAAFMVAWLEKSSGKSEDFDAVEALKQAPKTPAGALDLYDRWASSYDKDLASWGYVAPGLIADRVHAFVQSGEVLDVGCGTGLVGQHLREKGWGGSLVGIDISADSLELALARRASGDAAVYQETKAVDLSSGGTDFAEDRFQAIVCVGTLSYLKEYLESIFKEWLRILKPGGRIMFTHKEAHNTPEFKTLVASLPWKEVEISDLEVYLPLNPEYCKNGDADKLRYYVFERSA